MSLLRGDEYVEWASIKCQQMLKMMINTEIVKLCNKIYTRGIYLPIVQKTKE